MLEYGVCEELLAMGGISVDVIGPGGMTFPGDVVVWCGSTLVDVPGRTVDGTGCGGIPLEVAGCGGIAVEDAGCGGMPVEVPG